MSAIICTKNLGNEKDYIEFSEKNKLFQMVDDDHIDCDIIENTNDPYGEQPTLYRPKDLEQWIKLHREAIPNKEDNWVAETLYTMMCKYPKVYIYFSY